jgi:hypothetical protein
MENNKNNMTNALTGAGQIIFGGTYKNMEIAILKYPPKNFKRAILPEKNQKYDVVFYK